MTSANRSSVIVQQPGCEPSPFSTDASVILHSTKLLKSVGEGKHPCLGPTLVLSHFPVLLLFILTALVAFLELHNSAN